MNTAASAAILLPKAAVWARGAIRRDRANAYALLEPWTLPPLGGDLPRLGLMPPEPYEDERLRVEIGQDSADSQDSRDSGAAANPANPVNPVEKTATITVLPWELSSVECDGCTCAPDSWGDLEMYVGALFHDRWYLSMESIAEAWGWDVARVRKLGDVVFTTILCALARDWEQDLRARPGCWFRRAWREMRILYTRAGVRLYYRGVRAFGGIAHEAMKKTTSPGGGGGISPLLLSAPVALAGLLLLGAGCSGCAPLPNAWDDTVGLYRIDPPAVAFTNTVTGANFRTTEYTEDTEDPGEGE